MAYDTAGQTQHGTDRTARLWAISLAVIGALVDTDEDIQGAVEGPPPGVDITVEQVGGERVTPDSAVSEPSARQREAIETALAVGYYAVPREATIETVAEQLDCATATAAEHLKKAEATVFRALLGG
jgi:hypothetical protein